MAPPYVLPPDIPNMELPIFMLFEVFDLGAVREPMGVISFGVRLYGVRDQDFMVLVECALRCGGTAGGRFSNVVGGGGNGVIGDLMSSFSEESSPGEGGKVFRLSDVGSLVAGELDEEDEEIDVELGFKMWQTSLCFSTEAKSLLGRLPGPPLPLSLAGEHRPG
ncbi:hypothetical protein GQX74_001503 [Glossina fuscipes]|nr:hypothetical protein GQX74_001503 [Glossina fuscipes]